MITDFNNFVNKFLGISFALPANGLGGSRATSFLVAHFALQNTTSNPAAKKSGPAIQRDKLRRKAKGQKGRGSEKSERVRYLHLSLPPIPDQNSSPHFFHRQLLSFSPAKMFD